MPAKLVPPYAALDLTVADDAWVADVSPGDLLRLQAIVDSGTWGLGEISVETSGDGVNWVELVSVNEGPAAAIAAADEALYLGAYFLEAIALVQFRVSTKQAGACEVSVHLTIGSTSPIQQIKTYSS